ncbi:hypothetical protein KA405_03500 [Patescibacteria group bacterium]|nr:hypothetical protein [Patescibacteria group bacterium]
MSNIENKSVASIKDDLRAEHKNHVDGKYYYEEMLATSDSIANKIKDNLQVVA